MRRGCLPFALAVLLLLGIQIAYFGMCHAIGC